ncbi:hypothetical protein FQN60_000137 [Etheostoma spectabile]|uniref:Uncharacterized protein n=1 Tax=Etheostoma spectabile TaxID=54343 RepID=A0A5J5C9V5_9PERO|nr:hypothetical protein FQN60_000137 [Etheostoma spectabile]
MSPGVGGTGRGVGGVSHPERGLRGGERVP